MADTPDTLLTTVVHHVPGRLRLRVWGAPSGTGLLDQVAHRLRHADGVQAVRVNPASSSLVIRYRASDQDFVRRIQRHPALSRWPSTGPGVPAEAPPSGLPAECAASRPLPDRSHVAQAIMATSLRLDSSVRRASAGYVDLRLLLPMVFAGAGSYMARSGRGTPMWMTLAMSAFHAFLSLHPSGAPCSGRSVDAPAVPAT